MEEIIKDKFKSEGIAIMSQKELWTRLGNRNFMVKERVFYNGDCITDIECEYVTKELRQFVEDEEIESDTYILVNRIDNIITIRQEYKEQDILKINEWDLIGVA